MSAAEKILPGHAKYARLFQPLDLGHTTIKNRSIMAPCIPALRNCQTDLNAWRAYYAERAAGGVGMIITGGIAPNPEGGMTVKDGDGNEVFAASKLQNEKEVEGHAIVTEAVHDAAPDCKFVMQILHMGPLAYNDQAVAPSPVKSRIGAFAEELDVAGIEKQIADHAHCAAMAKKAGYDGVEIIGSAGYLLSTFLVEKTNQRTDEWGGSYENRMRFPLEVAKRCREAVGDDFIIVFRIAAMDMLQGGMSWDEVALLAREPEKAAVPLSFQPISPSMESAVPTTATMVPRAAFTSVTGRVRGEVDTRHHLQPH